MEANTARLLATLFIVVGMAGCSDKVAEENKRKAELYDAAQLAAARAQTAAQAAATAREANLKTCFDAAKKNRSDSLEAGWQKADCNTQHPEQMTTEHIVVCNYVAELADRGQKEDEDRCVKLYK
jgi:FKBP-type peptidyl-prolyl cis-trans isomerase